MQIHVCVCDGIFCEKRGLSEVSKKVKISEIDECGTTFL